VLTVGVLAEGDAVPCLGGMLDVVTEHLATNITTPCTCPVVCPLNNKLYREAYMPLASTVIWGLGQELAYL
jgi:hypothetical protein